MAEAALIRLPPLPSIRDVLRLYQLRAAKSMSQNFLMDPRITSKIVSAAGKIKHGHVCEIGPGPGSITRSILRKSPKHLLVIEKDRRFHPMLELLSEACGGRMQVELRDVTTYDLSDSFPEEESRAWEEDPPNIHLIGNLPFNVSTFLIIRWLEQISKRDSAWSYGRVKLTLTFQKEVAERMIAGESSPQRCRLSFMCQNWCHVTHKFNILGASFVPKPDVDVGVVHLIPRKVPYTNLPFSLVEKVTRQCFIYRRKAIVDCAETLFPPGEKRKRLAEEMISGLTGIRPHFKPYQLDNENFAELCRAYQDICNKYPHIQRFQYGRPKTTHRNCDILD